MVEQFSAASSAALDQSVAALIDELRRYVDEVGGLRGSTSDAERVEELGQRLEGALIEFSERAWDHTGQFPVSVAQWLGADDLDDEDEEYDDDDVADAPTLSVVSRWDLRVADRDALLAAGRAAHRRSFPQDGEADAKLAVDRPALAVYALLHEAGEPWFDLPGVDVLSGARQYVVPDESLQRPDPDDPQALPVDAPDGVVDYSEDWLQA